MKHLFKIMLVAGLALSLGACDDSEVESTDPALDVTPINIAGVWMLDSWKGAAPAEGTFVYIDFAIGNSSERTFTLYQNLESTASSARRITGRYAINVNAYAEIRGIYDHGMGDWAHRYEVTELKMNTMTWVATDDESDVTVYKRCNKVPSDILELFPAENN